MSTEVWSSLYWFSLEISWLVDLFYSVFTLNTFHCRENYRASFPMKEYVLKELLKIIVLVILRKPGISHHYKSLHLP